MANYIMHNSYPDNSVYWKNLTSVALRSLQERGEKDAVFVIKNSLLDVELNNHDNWNGGIDYWDIVFQLKYRDYTTIVSKKNEIEAILDNTLSEFHSDDRDFIANVIIKPVIERIIDWQAILPATKETVINLIEQEKALLTEIATGKSYKEAGVEEKYQEQHRVICSLAAKAGFDYPVTCNSLAEWWMQIRDISSYSERRAYISQLFFPVIELVNNSDDAAEIDFSCIASRFETLSSAIEDAQDFIRQGKYDSAVDRVHTVLHGYIFQLLETRGITANTEDGLPSLFSKLYTAYENNIKPAEVGTRIKAILRSASGMINAVNELRNNNTVAHPNGQLIQKREAQLVIRLVNAIVDYLEDIEQSIQ